MKALLIALALTQATTGTSLPDLSHPWSLQECIQWALEHNLSVAQQQNNLSQSEIDRNTAQWSWVPNLSASASENWSFGRGLGGNNTYERGNSASTSLSLGSSMPLFDGLATPARIELARLNLEAATKDLEKVKDDVSVSVAQAYVQILYNLEILDVAAEQVAVDSLQVVRLQGMLDNGKASAAELSQQKASLAQSRLSQVQAQNNVRTALLDMAQLLELPQWEDFRIQRPLLQMQTIPLHSPDQIYADALGIRPAIRAEELRLQGMDQSIRIARAQQFPSLSLSGGLGSNYYTNFEGQGFWDQLGNNFSQYVGLSLNIPIFTRFSARNQVRSARLNRSQQELQLQRSKNALYKEIVSAWNGAVAAGAKWESAREAEAAARDAFELQQAKYENGKATLTEFNESRSRLVKAQSDAAQAVCEYLFQSRLVEFYRGRPLEL